MHEQIKVFSLTENSVNAQMAGIAEGNEIREIIIGLARLARHVDMMHPTILRCQNAGTQAASVAVALQNRRALAFKVGRVIPAISSFSASLTKAEARRDGGAADMALACGATAGAPSFDLLVLLLQARGAEIVRRWGKRLFPALGTDARYPKHGFSPFCPLGTVLIACLAIWPLRGLGETGFDPLKQRGTMGWKAAHVSTVLNSAWIRNLIHINDFS